MFRWMVAIDRDHFPSTVQSHLGRTLTKPFVRWFIFLRATIWIKERFFSIWQLHSYDKYFLTKKILQDEG